MKNIVVLIMCLGALSSSCNKYLDHKPDIKMVVPRSLNDVDLLLNDYSTLNNRYPVYGELSADDYYLTDAQYESISDMDTRNAYVWSDQPYVSVMQWQTAYKTVYIANQAIDILTKLNKNVDAEKYARARGAAHFFRAFAFQQLVDVYCPAYSHATANVDLGIPLRLTAGIDESSFRASMKETYTQIIADYEVAVENLIVNEPNVGRPKKAAAYAGLARAYLNMGDYNKAFQYAEEGLKLNNDLIDFNSLNPNLSLPIPQFNKEVLFSASFSAAIPMSTDFGFVDSTLIKTYSSADLRLKCFYKVFGDDGEYTFRGNYTNNLITLFMGFTTSELYLIKAESAVRVDKVSEALISINTLLKSRWDKDVVYLDIVEENPEILLPIILKERRKELAFRGRRWADLKRLNLDERFQATLTRNIKGVTYTLPANSLLYAYRIPNPVLELGKIPQNKR